MRERARDKGRLENIVDYSRNVTMLIEGYSLDDFVADKRTYYSVMKNVEIVGEAAYMLSKAFKNSHPETPWSIVQGMRHVLFHDYANVETKELYNTAVNDIPVLRQQAERYLAETDWAEWELVDDPIEGVDLAHESNIRTAKKMKDKGYVAEAIAEITGLSISEIEDL